MVTECIGWTTECGIRHETSGGQSREDVCVTETCFTGSAMALLALIGGVIQSVIVALFWLGVRWQQDALQDARKTRDRALDVNEEAIIVSQRSLGIVSPPDSSQRGSGGSSSRRRGSS